MTTLRKHLTIQVVLAVLLMAAGYVLLAWVDWRAALAVFLIHTGANVERRVSPWLKFL